MPLSKYLIRNEYTLADPELYRAADKDDPEALLEAVSMAALVGLLRQLGDLAEFAAEIFHDLHEEVMATAARGHGLTARVKQLEAEVPSLEKAFFSQTHHSSFFTTGGIDWHPNLRSEQNLVTHGNLPRLIMDSYEECRAPPRLFLLDKFDVAGAGACLKRYTNPSFFKMESDSSVRASVQVHREKRIRKVKQKKGARLRDSEAPNAVPTHSKLHQLLLEERIENGYSNLARLVKLKKRQLNGSVVDGQAGKGYMEKFLENPSPDCKIICETSIFPLPVKPTSDDTSKAGIKILEISSISPLKNSIGDENTCSSPNAPEFDVNQFPEEVGETNGDLVIVKEQISVGVTDEMSFNDVKVSDETKLAINEQKKIEGSLARYLSDDMASEVDNYMDALTTMESELETDEEYKPNKHFLNIQKVTDAKNKDRQLQARFSDSQSFADSSTSDDISPFKQDINEEDIEVKARLSDSHSTGTFSTSDNNSSFKDEDEHTELQAHFSDSRSTENSSTSNVNSSSKKDESYFPHSDSLSTVVENIQSEPILFTATKCYEPEIEGTSTNQLSKIVEFQNTDSRKLFMRDDEYFTEDEVSDSGQTYSDLLTSGKESCSDLDPAKPASQSSETVSDKVELNIRIGIDVDREGLVESVASKPSSPSLIKDDTYPVDSSDKFPLDNMVDDDPYTHSHDLLQISNDSQDDSLFPFNEELDMNSGPNVVFDHQGSKDEDCTNIERQLSSTVVKVPPVSFLPGDLSSGLTHSNPQGGLSSTESEVSSSGLQSNYGNTPKMVHGDEIAGSSSSVDPVEGDCHFENPSPYNHVMVNGVIANIVESKYQTVSSVDSAKNDVGVITCPTSGMIRSPSTSLSNLQEPVPASSDSHQMDFNEVHEAVARESVTVPEGQQDVGHPKIVSADIQMNLNKLVPCDIPDLENSIEMSSPMEKIQHSAFLDDAKMVPEFSGSDTWQSESTGYGQNDLLQNDRNSFSSPPYNQLASETYSEPHLQSQVREQDAEFPLKYKENFDSEKSQSQRMQIYQLKQDDTSESVSEIPGDELSSFNYSPRSSGLESNFTQYDTDPLKPLLPDIFPKETETKLDEMPPMPPLPPMQWRMGKVQHASLDSHREELEVHQASVQPMQPIMPDMKSQFSLPALHGETLFRQNPFLPVMALESDKIRQSSGVSVGVSGHPVDVPFQIPIIANEGKGQYNYLVLDRNQMQNPFLTLPMVPTTMHPPHGYIVASEGERVQSSNPFAAILPAAYTVSGHDSTSSQVEPFQHPTQLRTEASVDDKTLEQPIHNEVSSDGPPNSHVIASEGAMVHNSDPCLSISCVNSGDDSISPTEKVTQSPSQLMTETSSDDTTLPQHMNVISMNRPPLSDIVTSEEEIVPNSTPCPPIASAESSASNHDSISPQEKLTHPQSQLLTETSSVVKTSDNVEGEQGRLGMSLMFPPTMESVEHNHSFQPFDGEMLSLDPYAQTSDFDSERTNVKPKHKIPRPRSPLIDAVAAHDKSKLKRVTEQVMHQIPKVDERDSWLEQIRTKSFNLKPAVATRPSIQGPKTNMKLAAILEKANSIRQALAGSDEDDDGDSWSDS